MRSTILLGMGIGLGSVLAGITIAYYADLPSGWKNRPRPPRPCSRRSAGRWCAAKYRCAYVRASHAQRRARRGVALRDPRAARARRDRRSPLQPRTRRVLPRSTAIPRASGAARPRADQARRGASRRRRRKPNSANPPNNQATGRFIAAMLHWPPSCLAIAPFFPSGASRRGRFRPEEGRSREQWLRTNLAHARSRPARRNGRRRSSNARVSSWRRPTGSG